MRDFKAWQSKNINSLGELSPEMYHRTDLATYRAGLRLCENAFISLGGTIVNAPQIKSLQTISGVSTKIKVFKYSWDNISYDGIVFIMDGVNIHVYGYANKLLTFIESIPATYTLDELEIISYTQAENLCLFCCKGRKPAAIRVDGDTPADINVVEYWDGIVQPPVKPIDAVYGTNTGSQLMEWHQNQNSNTVIFRPTLKEKAQPSDPDEYEDNIYDPAFIDKLDGGVIEVFGGKYKINEIEQALDPGDVPVPGSYIFTTSVLTSGGSLPPSWDYIQGTTDKEDVWETLYKEDIYFYESIFRDDQYPAVCLYYNSRLIFGGIENTPNAVAASKIRNYTNFLAGTNDDDGFITFIPGNEVSQVTDLAPGASLIVFTDNGIFATEILRALTPFSILIEQEGIPQCTTDVNKWIKSRGSIYFLSEENDRIYRMSYTDQATIYMYDELTLMSRHLTKSGITNINSFRYDTDDFIMANTQDYKAMCLADISQGVNAWMRYIDTTDISFLTIKTESLGFRVVGTDIEMIEFDRDVRRDDMKIELLPPYPGSAGEAATSDLPLIAKIWLIERAKIAVIGNFLLEVGGVQEGRGFGEDILTPSLREFDRILADSKRPLEIKNLTSDRVEISAIYYKYSAEEEV